MTTCACRCSQWNQCLIVLTLGLLIGIQQLDPGIIPSSNTKGTVLNHPPFQYAKGTLRITSRCRFTRVDLNPLFLTLQKRMTEEIAEAEAWQTTQNSHRIS